MRLRSLLARRGSLLGLGTLVVTALSGCTGESSNRATAAGAAGLAGSGGSAMGGHPEGGGTTAGGSSAGTGTQAGGGGGGTSGSSGAASNGGAGGAGGGSVPIPPLDESLRERAKASMVPLAAWYSAQTGLWNETDWWTSANQLETVIDYSRETGDPTYADLIDNTFVKNQAGNFDHFGFYDDDGWFAIAWIKAYDLTHQKTYLDMAKIIFQRMVGGWDDKCGGGIYWASAKAGNEGLKNKNAIPNSLFMQTAALLHQRTPGDGGAGSYLDWAEREWAWFQSKGMLRDDGLVVDGLTNLTDCKAAGPVFTYNNGVLMGALVDLGTIKNDASMLALAQKMATATMTKMVDAEGTLKETPCGGDICTQFKGVFMRNLLRLYRVRPTPEAKAFMKHQSDQLWDDNRSDQDQYGYEWHLPFDKGTASRQSSAIDALLAAVGSSQPNLSLLATATGSAPCADSALAYAFDGGSRAGSKWCAAGAGGQTLTADLGAARSIVGFRVRHAGAGGEEKAWNTRDYELEVSVDGQVYAPAVAVRDNTNDVTTHPIAPTTARYVRLHVTSAQTATEFLAARIYELEIFGTGP